MLFLHVWRDNTEGTKRAWITRKGGAPVAKETKPKAERKSKHETFDPAPVNRDDWPEHLRKRIPPGWTNVKFNPNKDDPLWAIGFDSEGRRQPAYDPQYKKSASAIIFERIRQLEPRMPAILARNSRNMDAVDPKVRDHADCAALIMGMGIRPGSETDTKAKVKAYAATTLEGRHIGTNEEGGTVLDFIGKKGVHIQLPVTDPKLAIILKARAAAVGPNGQLFQKVTDRSMRDYVHSIGGFKVKDFRAMFATKEARREVADRPKPATAKEREKVIKEIGAAVAKKLGNTRDICLQHYIPPWVFDEWHLRDQQAESSSTGEKQQDAEPVPRDPTTESSLPDLNWPGGPPDWRNDDCLETDDDELLETTDPIVVAILGFDPKDIGPGPDDDDESSADSRDNARKDAVSPLDPDLEELAEQENQSNITQQFYRQQEERERRRTPDDFKEENVNREDDGKFASKGGSKPTKADTKNDEPTHYPAVSVTVEEAEKTVASIVKKLNYPAELIKVMSGGTTHHMGSTDKVFDASGISNQETGEIFLYAKHLGPDDVAGCLAHEIMHQKFQTALNKMSDELDNFRPGVMDRNGFPKPEFSKEYPAFAVLGPVMMAKEHQLREDDGVTNYSAEWWQTYEDGDCDLYDAIHETLAEMANLEQSVSRNFLKEISTDDWFDLYKQINRMWPQLKKQAKELREKRGKPPATGDDNRTPEQKSAAAKKAWESRKRATPKPPQQQQPKPDDDKAKGRSAAARKAWETIRRKQAEARKAGEHKGKEPPPQPAPERHGPRVLPSKVPAPQEYTEPPLAKPYDPATAGKPHEEKPSDPSSNGIAYFAGQVAGHLRFPAHKITASQKTVTFQLDGTERRAGGNSNPRTGEIRIFVPTMFARPAQAIRGLAAHEIMHQKFAAVMNRYWGGEKQSRVVLNALRGLISDKDARQLELDDGVTQYSKDYWSEFEKSPPAGKGLLRYNAVNETLAEMSKVHYETGVIPGSEIWRGYYKAVNDLYEKGYRIDPKATRDPKTGNY